MRKKGFKGRCEKKSLSKSKEVCRTYDPIQNMYAEKLEESPDIQEIRCNVLLEGLYKRFCMHQDKRRFNGQRMLAKG